MKKLGQLLLDFGWIDQSELQQALQAQSVVGGRIGSCLLEVGALDEAMLLRALAHQRSVPAASSVDLRNIPKEVHSLLATRVALRCLAIPFRMLGSELYVALLDVSNLDLHDEIAFATGKQVRVHVGNEVRIFCSLHQYYGRDLSDRFQLLEADLDRPAATPPRRSGFGKHLERINDGTPRNVPAIDTAEEAGDVKESEVPGTAQTAPTAITKSFPPKSPPEPPMSLGLVQSVDVSPKTTAPFLPRFDSLQEFSAALNSMDDREAMAQLFVEFIRPYFRRVLLFKVLSDLVVGWLGAGRGIDHLRLNSSMIDLDLPSIFHDLRNGRPVHHGPLASLGAHLDVFASFGQQPPETCFSFPVLVGERLVSVVVGEPQAGIPSARLEHEVAGACTALGEAFGEYILRQRKGRNAISPNHQTSVGSTP